MFAWGWLLLVCRSALLLGGANSFSARSAAGGACSTFATTWNSKNQSSCFLQISCCKHYDVGSVPEKQHPIHACLGIRHFKAFALKASMGSTGSSTNGFHCKI